MNTDRVKSQLKHVIDNVDNYTKDDLMRELDRVVIEHCYPPDFFKLLKKIEEQQLN